MDRLDSLSGLFVGWAFFLQSALIVHFALRRSMFESYTLKLGWIVYALSIPAVIVSILLIRGGKDWPYWIGGFLYLLFSAYGHWVDYVKAIPFRSPFRARIGVPYVLLYLGAIMFYWWPLGNLGRPLWHEYAVLFIIGTILNIRSHRP